MWQGNAISFPELFCEVNRWRKGSPTHPVPGKRLTQKASYRRDKNTWRIDDLRTPSLVQVQLVHGDIFFEDPSAMLIPFTRHWVTSSRQWVMSRSAMERQGTRGFLKINRSTWYIHPKINQRLVKILKLKLDIFCDFQIIWSRRSWWTISGGW